MDIIVGSFFKKKPVVITAPSGAGKTTLIGRVTKKLSYLSYCVSHTTRLPRADELEKKDYYFISEKDFFKKIKKNYFLEWAKVHENYYGTSMAELQKITSEGKRPILDLDVQGALSIMSKIEGLYIYISAPNLLTIKDRLISRNKDNKKDIEIRLKNAESELLKQSKWQHVIINDDLDLAEQQLIELIDSQ